MSYSDSNIFLFIVRLFAKKLGLIWLIGGGVADRFLDGRGLSIGDGTLCTRRVVAVLKTSR